MKKRSILCGLACTILMTSCGIMPAEEQLPSAPISKEVKEIEHVMTLVQRGDLEVVDKLRCTYKPEKSEKLAFEVGGEYIATIYAETGDSVEAGELIAELDMGDLPEQLENQQYVLESLQMNKRHIEQQQNLAVRRVNLQIQLALRAINGLDVASLSENEKEIAAKAIECGYLYREGDMLYTKILVNALSDIDRVFDISNALQNGYFDADAEIVAAKVAELIKKSLPDYLLGEWEFANRLANMPIVDAVVECLIEKGVLTPPEDGIGAEGCWMSVEK